MSTSIGVRAVPTQKRHRTGERLRTRGFDRSWYAKSTRSWHVACSQCEALVINGIAAHESGCLNESKGLSVIGTRGIE